MGYCIQYAQGVARKTELKENKRTRKRRTGLSIALTLLACFFIAASLGWSADFLIPGDREVTKAAFVELMQDVEQGQDIKTAIAAFCREVISGADAEQSADLD